MEKKEGTVQISFLAKEKIILENFFGPKPEKLELPLVPIDTEINIASSTQSKPEQNARSAQQQMNWQKKCQRLTQVEIMSEEIRGHLQIEQQSHCFIFPLAFQQQDLKNPHTMIDTFTINGHV